MKFNLGMIYYNKKEYIKYLKKLGINFEETFNGINVVENDLGHRRSINIYRGNKLRYREEFIYNTSNILNYVKTIYGVKVVNHSQNIIVRYVKSFRKKYYTIHNEQYVYNLYVINETNDRYLLDSSSYLLGLLPSIMRYMFKKI